MSDQIITGKGAAYRAASGALHRDPIADRQAARFPKLWECSFADLIRADFYDVLALPDEASGNLLDAGCGAGIEAANLQRLTPGLKIHGIDISSVSLAGAVAQPGAADAVFYQAALERLPFADAVFDYVTAHEVIEHAERFGLAQLHQLRGRIGRGDKPSTCLLLYASPLSELAKRRLGILRETEDGFRIAEEDLRLRGAGEVLGTRQSGLPTLRLADLAVHEELVAMAHDDARLVLERDPHLESDRGQALRVLLYLFRRDEAVHYLRAG